MDLRSPWTRLSGFSEFLIFQIAGRDQLERGVTKQKRILAVVETPSHLVKVRPRAAMLARRGVWEESLGVAGGQNLDRCVRGSAAAHG